MRVGIMATNNGSHPPAKWADESAAQIVDCIVIDPASLGFDALSEEKDRFEVALRAALLEHHTKVLEHEQEAIKKHSHDRLEHPVEPEAVHMEAALADVEKVADKSMFAAHFRKAEVKKFVASTLNSHFGTVRHSERSWHADKNPDEPQAKAFRARWHG